MRLLAFTMSALAWTSAVATQAAVPEPACRAHETAIAEQETADWARVRKVAITFNKEGYPGLKMNLAEVEAVLAHAPIAERDVDCQGFKVLRVVGGGSEEALLLAMKGTQQSHRVHVVGPSPYPTAAFLLGSYNVETENYPVALTYLQRGLALSPTDPKLATEAANTLSHLGRSVESLPIIDRALADNGTLEPLDRARLLRSRGFALGEARRYDEAEAAYRESLKLQPGHVGAQNELIYLARMKSGAAPTQAVMMTADKAATTSADAVLAAKPH